MEAAAAPRRKSGWKAAQDKRRQQDAHQARLLTQQDTRKLKQRADDILRYVPTASARRYLLTEVEETSNEAFAENLSCAVLFSDVSGFTKLTEKLKKEKGNHGAEKLTDILNAYFEVMIGTVIEHGGDVIKFAGDAVLSIFRPAPGESLTDSTLRCAHCAAVMMGKLNNYKTSEGIILKLHIGMSSGKVRGCEFGDGQRKEYVVAGPALTQLAKAEPQAGHGEIVVSPEVWEMVGELCVGKPVTEKEKVAEFGSGFVYFASAKSPLPLYKTIERKDIIAKLKEDPAKLKKLMVYVPRSIQKQLETGTLLPEFRDLNCAFTAIKGLDMSQVRSDVFLRKLEKAVLICFSACEKYEGQVSRLSIDDKGIVFKWTFGLPPYNHDDDEARIVLAAMDIRDSLRKMRLTANTGITTGKLFFGNVGSTDRVEYTEYGESVNMAARYMSKATNEILTDEETMRLAVEDNPEIHFDTLKPVKLKGKDEPQPCFRPQYINHRLRERARRLNYIPMSGRIKERRIFEDAVMTLLGDGVEGEDVDTIMDGSGTGMVFTADAGAGKTTFIDWVVNELSVKYPIEVFVGVPMANSTNLGCWKGIFEKLLGIADVIAGSPEASQRAEANLREILPESEHSFCSAMNVLLETHIPVDDKALGLAGEDLFAKIVSISVLVIKHAAAEKNLVICLDDFQNMHFHSISLALAIRQASLRCVILVMGRPVDATSTIAVYYNKLVHPTSGFKAKVLSPMSRLDVADLISTFLKIDEADSEGERNQFLTVVDLILSKGMGNLLYTKELASTMVNQGLLKVVRGNCTIPMGMAALHKVELPSSIDDIVVANMDKMTGEQQLLLKMAAVIGVQFSSSAIEYLHPDVEESNLATRIKLRKQLKEMCHQRDTFIDSLHGKDGSYHFKTPLNRQVIYANMAFGFKKEQHEKMVAYLEELHSGVVPQDQWPVIANHCFEAEHFDKAFNYYVKSGTVAHDTFANEDAAQLLTKALTISTGASTTGDYRGKSNRVTLQAVAHCRSLLAHTYLRLGRSDDALPLVEESLELLISFSPPKPAAFKYDDRMRLAIWYEKKWMTDSTPWLSRRRLKGRFNDNIENDELLSRLAHTFEMQAQLALETGHRRLHDLAVINALNIARVIGPSVALARAYSSACYMAGIGGKIQKAEAFKQQAFQVLSHIKGIAATEHVEVHVLLQTSQFELQQGRWDDAYGGFKRASELNAAMGNKRRFEDNSYQMALVCFFRGQYETGTGLCMKAADSGRHRNDMQSFLNLSLLRAMCMIYHNQIQEARVVMNEVDGLVDDYRDFANVGMSYDSVSALMLLVEGDGVGALKAAKAALEVIKPVERPNSMALFVPWHAVCEVLVEHHATELAAAKEAVMCLSRLTKPPTLTGNLTSLAKNTLELVPVAGHLVVEAGDMATTAANIGHDDPVFKAAMPRLEMLRGLLDVHATKKSRKEPKDGYAKLSRGLVLAREMEMNAEVAMFEYCLADGLGGYVPRNGETPPTTPRSGNEVGTLSFTNPVAALASSPSDPSSPRASSLMFAARIEAIQPTVRQFDQQKKTKERLGALRANKGKLLKLKSLSPTAGGMPEESPATTPKRSLAASMTQRHLDDGGRV